MIYTKQNLKNISFPIGGIGTGSIGLTGNGSFMDWEIFNKPDKGSIMDTYFAVRAEYPNGKSTTKILQGDWQGNYIGEYTNGRFRGYGFGASGIACGFPHFKDLEFDGRFPIAKLTFSDEDFPADVVLTAFNPFIPLDSDNSSIPAAFFDIQVVSKEENIKYTVVLRAENPFPKTINEIVEHEKYSLVKMKKANIETDDIEYSEITVGVNDNNGIVQEYLYRGEWKDAKGMFWHELTHDELKPRHYDTARYGDGCCIGTRFVLNEADEKQTRFVLSWHKPFCYNYWKPMKDENDNHVTWKNYYATKFENSALSCIYSLEHFEILYNKTKTFCDVLHGSTLDDAVIDAISSTMSVLKSPTVLRLENGEFYGWEGVHEREGSCEGTCTHVWSYNYALCFLFPDLERSLREVEFKYDVDKYGRMGFRTMLPLGRGIAEPPCLDGQMASVFKTYREWKISGDDNWLRSQWESVKKVLEFAWSEHNNFEWDKDKDGILEGRQHHTLDMELFGPSSWLQGMYLTALKAASEMALYLGEEEKSQEYMALYQNGYQYTKENLFNGMYFIQKVDMKNKEYIEHFKCPWYWNEEKEELKYQIGEGSAIDQLLGQWHASLLGLGDVFDVEQRQIALKSMFKYNFKQSMRDFANPWRVFVLNDEKGAIMCDYPEGVEKPIIPVPYCEECMTGFEYSFAGLLISEGFVEEGLQVVRAIRERYDGEKRNPWNEIECGSNYARAMASFALLPIFSGFEFDLPKKHIGFNPIVSGDFQCFWSLGTGWGIYKQDAQASNIKLQDGYLELSSLSIPKNRDIKTLMVDGKNVSFTQTGNKIDFQLTKVKHVLNVEW